jgi:hypothetical protein
MGLKYQYSFTDSFLLDDFPNSIDFKVSFFILIIYDNYFSEYESDVKFCFYSKYGCPTSKLKFDAFTVYKQLMCIKKEEMFFMPLYLFLI